MKFTLRNLGVLKEAELELGALTVICGKNNSGKTYITYSIYGFLTNWKSLQREAKPVKIDIPKLLDQGTLKLDLQPLIDHATDWFVAISKSYQSEIHEVFSSPESKFENSEFLAVPTSIPVPRESVSVELGAGRNNLLSIEKVPGKNQLLCTLLSSRPDSFPRNAILEKQISRIAYETVYSDLVPAPFIASAERTGAAIFQKELDLNRNRLIDQLARQDPGKNVDPFDLVATRVTEYSAPVQDNVYFIRELASLQSTESRLSQEHPEILEAFSDIIGGNYGVNKRDSTVFYSPNGPKKTRLSLQESSSAVRSLLDVGFYLRHRAEPGDVLIIDEPELNLHPENQRKLARLLVRLVRVGIKVFITTHSDYILKEFGTILMLSRKGRSLKKIASDHGYSSEEVLAPNEVKVYVTELSPRSRGGSYKLSPCKVTAELGIEARAFDPTIAEMNSIVEEIQLYD